MAQTRLPKAFRNRVLARLQSFQDLTTDLRLRNVSEADTVAAVKDMLGELLGFDKYRDVAGEVRVHGGVCDLGVSLRGRLRLLVEVKAACVALSDHHVQQVVNYGFRTGVEDVALTNGCDWRVYRLIFRQPVQVDEVVRFSLADLRPKARHDLDQLYLLSREGVSAGALEVRWRRQQVINRFTLAQVLLTAPMLGLVRSELRRRHPVDVRTGDIARLLAEQVFQPELLQGGQVQKARSRLGLGA